MESENDGKPAEELTAVAVAVGDLKVDEVNDTAADAEKDDQMIEGEPEVEKPPEDLDEEMKEQEQQTNTADNGQNVDETDKNIVEKDDDNSSSVSDRRSIELTRSNSNSNFSQQEAAGGDNNDDNSSASFSDTTNNITKSNENDGNKNKNHFVETIDIADVDMSTLSEDSYSQISSSGQEPEPIAKVPQKTARRKLYNSQGGMGKPTYPNYPSHRMVKDQALFHDTRDFMMGFDPQRRNKQKRRKKYGQDGRQLIFADEFEECDCLRENCPGCHFPCRVCQDPRCGHECRNARKWLYDTIELDGRQIEIRNHRNTSL